MRIGSVIRRHALVAAALVCCTGTAQAALIVETVSLSTGTSSAPGAGIGWYDFELFDPTLGELNSVEVELSGFLTLSLNVVPLILGPPGSLPLNQTVSATLTQQLNTPIGGAFDFTPFPQVLVQHTAAFGTFTSQVVTNYSFRFDEASDAVGFATVSGGSSPLGALSTFVSATPALATGTRADFIDTFGIGPVPLSSMWSSTYTSTSSFNQLDFTYDGSLRLLYDYTPAGTDPDPAPVTEPSTLLLLASGSLVTLLARRQRRDRGTRRLRA